MENQNSATLKDINMQKEMEISAYHLFMQSPVAILILRGNDYRVELANNLYLQLVDKGKEFIGKSIFESLPELNSQGIKALFDGVVETGIPYHGKEYEVFLLRNQRREQCFFNFVYQPIRGLDNTISGIMVVATEVTEQVLARQRIEAAEMRFHKMLLNSPFSFAFLKGKEMTVIFANDAIKKCWGKGDYVEGKSLYEVLPEIVDHGFPKILEAVLTTGIPYFGNEVYVCLQRNGQWEDAYFNFVYQPYVEMDDTISGITIIAYEVTTQVAVHKAVAESEKKYRLMADLMPDKVSNGDANGQISYYNQAWQDYLGWSIDEFKADSWSKLVHPEDLIKANKSWAKCLETGDNFEMEVRILHKSGVYKWHLSRVKAVKDQNGNVKWWIGVNVETEEQRKQTEKLEQSVLQRTKALQEAVELLRQKNQEIEIAKTKLLSKYSRTLIDASLDPLIIIDLEGKITDMNQALAHITGMARADLIGTNCFEFFTEPEKARKVFEEVFAKGFVANYPMTIKDHKLIDVLFNGSVYKDDHGKILGAVIVARDVTEQQRAQLELITAKNKAEDAAKSKQQFLSNMSHEIRTPMNAIIGFTKVVLKTDLSAKQKEYLMAIKMSGDALIVLINDILDLAKVDAGKMTFEKTPFNLGLSISTILHLFETKVQEKNLRLIKLYDTQIPNVIVGDPIRLHQIILNLMSNAVKFTSKGSITVSVALVDEDSEQVTIEFSVTDTGIGISEAKLVTIFDNFQQASSDTARLFGGTGLGLSIVKQLVEPQGGKISVKSKLNEGSTFSFTLNFLKTDAEPEIKTETMALDEGVKNMKVLVAEDMALNQLLMKTILDDFGFERDIADNGKIAIAKLTQKPAYGWEKPYDIILMDLQMPEMNGFEATEYIRKVLKLNIPIIALTADVTTVDVAKCKAVGMNDYIAKPIDERLLYSKMVSLVKKAVLNDAPQSNEAVKLTKLRCTNLNYLMQRTKANPKLMMEMILAYLEQTPPLINAMKQSFYEKDWHGLHGAVHKMIPSFLIMGMNTDFESMAKKVLEYARTQEQTEQIPHFVLQLEIICVQACEELKEELNDIKNKK
jgi:PAS domain S-box-containing protein